MEKVPSERRISLTIKISETETGITVEGLDEDQIRAVIKVDLKKELAKNNLEMKKNINKCFGKLGETIFSCQKIDILLDPILFIPLSPPMGGVARPTVRITHMRTAKWI